MRQIYQKNISEVKNAVKGGFDALTAHVKTTAKKPVICEGHTRIARRSFFQTGFTLIELLVVVLIIGILAAVALPQYRKAVVRSKMAEVFIATKDLMQAEQLYYLANGSYTTDASELEVRYPINPASSSQLILKNGYCELGQASIPGRVYCGIGGYLTYFRDMKSSLKMCCTYPETNYEADGLCQAETGASSWGNGCNDERICHCWSSAS